MIITKNLVILNFPKTGSSFVRKVMKDIYFKRRNKNIITKILHKVGLNKIEYKEIMTDHPTISNYKDQHGCYDQIPKMDKDKKIISVIRNPYYRLKSMYNFKWWAKNPYIQEEILYEKLPHFPELTLLEFMEYQHLLNDNLKSLYNIRKEIIIGNQSIQFIRLFFKDHKKILANITDDYINSGIYKKDMCNIKFIENNNLNKELFNLLLDNGYSEKELEFILHHEKVNTTMYDENNTLDENVIKHVSKNEWMLLKILQDNGFNYEI